MPLGDEDYFELNTSEKKQKQDKVLKTGYKLQKHHPSPLYKKGQQLITRDC